MPEIREDAADVAAREAAKRQAAAEEEFKRASQALQRGLPLPRALNRDILRTGKAKDDVQVGFERRRNAKALADLLWSVTIVGT